jgi:hypothetical protein
LLTNSPKDLFLFGQTEATNLGNDVVHGVNISHKASVVKFILFSETESSNLSLSINCSLF